MTSLGPNKWFDKGELCFISHRTCDWIHILPTAIVDLHRMLTFCSFAQSVEFFERVARSYILRAVPIERLEVDHDSPLNAYSFFVGTEFITCVEMG